MCESFFTDKGRDEREREIETFPSSGSMPVTMESSGRKKEKRMRNEEVRASGERSERKGERNSESVSKGKHSTQGGDA